MVYTNRVNLPFKFKLSEFNGRAVSSSKNSEFLQFCPVDPLVPLLEQKPSSAAKAAIA